MGHRGDLPAAPGSSPARMDPGGHVGRARLGPDCPAAPCAPWEAPLHGTHGLAAVTMASQPAPRVAGVDS